MKRITVILSDEEYEKVRAEAGLVPLSAWLRSRALPYPALNPPVAETAPPEFYQEAFKQAREQVKPPARLPVETWRRGPRQKGDKGR